MTATAPERYGVRAGHALPLVRLPDADGRLVALVPRGPAVVLLLTGLLEPDLAALRDLAAAAERDACVAVAVAPGPPRSWPTRVRVLHDVRRDLAWILGLEGAATPTRLVVGADRVVTEVTGVLEPSR